MSDGPYHWEDLQPGQKQTTASVSVSEAEIIAFAKQFDPQPFHTDPAAAPTLAFGGLVASGWHTAALTMRLIVGGGLKFVGGAIGRGLEEMSWPKPVRPGDTLTAINEVLGTRPLNSMRTHGLVRLRTTTLNQHGETVQMMVSIVLVPRRTKER